MEAPSNQRKEVYVTTGTRIVVRFFGGWDYGDEDAFKPEAAQLGYNGGVPRSHQERAYTSPIWYTP